MNILITCAGSPIMDEVIHLLKSIKFIKKIFLVDSAKNKNQKIKKVPFGNQANYAKVIKNFVKKNKINYIFVYSNEEAEALSHYKWARDISHLDTFENTKLINNKFKLYEKIKEKNNNLVPHYSLATKNSLLKNYDSLILRPIISRGSRNVFKIIKNKIFNSQEIGFEIFKKLKKFNLFQEYFLSEYLEGEKYSLDGIFKNGEILTFMIRSNGKNIKFQTPTRFAKAVLSQKVVNFSKKIARILNLNGFHQIECGYQGNNLKLIEINPRLDATLPITICYKTNFFEHMILGEKKSALKLKYKYYQRNFFSKGFN